MSEYVCEIKIYRPARGEGDVPLLIVAGSGESSGHTLTEHEAMKVALAKAAQVVKAGIAAREIAK